jgi:CRISPR-associated endonuclease/helicase Cas3
LLRGHLAAVAGKAREFSSTFDAGETGFLLGLLHDLGKINQAFQDYLSRLEAGENLQQGPPHAVWGAALVYWLLWERCRDGESWKEFALPVAGHHGGLASSSVVAPRLTEFIESHPSEMEQLRRILVDRDIFSSDFSLPVLRPPGDRDVFIRMLFSALVDADFLETEKHFSREKVHLRGKWPDLSELWRRFAQQQANLLDEHRGDVGNVNQVRREVYEACLKAASADPGLFRLTVPTGGGKTRSGLGFALAHALGPKHNLQRIVVALPYTSIIDQTAKEYRKILGQDAVIEHHSQIPIPESEAQDAGWMRRRLAAENWEAPVIVTTTVQLFESLLGNRTSKVRKLHNLVRSVIVLDEVQCLPVELLKTTVGVLQTLVREYHVSVVLCTATQPAVDRTPYLSGFDEMPVREIVPQYAAHFRALKRVDYERREVPVSTGELAAEILGLPQKQVLVILNTRRDAMELLGALGDAPHVYHLSTLLCGAHRKAVLEEIRLRLDPKHSLPVRLISTQVVEAGVDIDFPVVYRAIAPLDRIVQAAGRCNREGKLPGLGRVVLFQPEAGGMPKGAYKAGFELANLLLGRNPTERLHDPELYQEYFQGLYSYVDTDKRKIEPDRVALDYSEVARKYRLIDDDTVAVVVRYSDSAARLADWERWPSREAWRALQPFIVNLYRFEAARFESEGWLQQLADGLYVWLGKYDAVRGIEAASLDPADLYVGEDRRRS